MKKMSMFLFFIQLSTASLFALDSPKSFQVTGAQIDKLASQFNGINYNLYLYLPKNYAKSTKHYPVIYLLDADYSFLLASQIIEHLSDRNRIEEYVIAGIAYADVDYKKNRTR